MSLVLLDVFVRRAVPVEDRVNVDRNAECLLPPRAQEYRKPITHVLPGDRIPEQGPSRREEILNVWPAHAAVGKHSSAVRAFFHGI